MNTDYNLINKLKNCNTIYLSIINPPLDINTPNEGLNLGSRFGSGWFLMDVLSSDDYVACSYASCLLLVRRTIMDSIK